MELITTVKAMQEWAMRARLGGVTTALVPTMGALHEGHLALVREAKRHAQKVGVSIFVNPIQFGPNEDLDRYPRDLEGDLEKLRPLGVDYVFTPDVSDIYPSGFQTTVVVGRITKHLCGLTRIGHFEGVATVVLKLFNICLPDVAVFGLKDYQQVRVIEQMVTDLNIPVRIVRHPTVREADGLAMSSRNSYLTEDERRQAPIIHRTLMWMADAIRQGKDIIEVIAEGRKAMEDAGGRVEYLCACDPDTLDDVIYVGKPVLLATAVHFGNTRLIDNELVTP